MKLSYPAPSSSVKINGSQNYKLHGRKSCNILSKISFPILSSSTDHFNNGRSNSKLLSTRNHRLSSTRACAHAQPVPTTITKKVAHFGDACWRFVRPYTIQGTVVASSALLGRALIENPSMIEWSLVLKALSGLFVLVCVNSYTAGINQIYDVEIDKINKPYLPVAAGDLSAKGAWLLVAFFAVAGFSVVGLTCDALITRAYCFAIFLGTVYSVPPLRLKAIPFGTILTIAQLRVLLNFGVYYSTRAMLGLPFQWSAPLIFITTFAIVIAAVISITKDLPDVEGDSKFEIPTLATIHGVRNVAYLGCGLLLFFYAAVMAAAIYMPQTLNSNLIVPVHGILALSLIYQTRVLEKANYTREASLKFYMFIWNLYYAEYIIFPFI